MINPGTAGSWWIGAVFDDNHQLVKDSFSVAALDGKFGKAIERDSLGRLTTVEGRSPLFDRDYVYRYDAAGQLTLTYPPDKSPRCPNLGGNRPFVRGGAAHYGHRAGALVLPEPGL